MGQPIPYQYRCAYGFDPCVVPIVEAIRRRFCDFLSAKATAKNRKPIGAVSELLKPRLIICVKWLRTSGNVLTTCVPMFWCRVPSIRRNASNPIRANRKANVKTTKMSCRNLFGGQVKRAGGGQAKSSICKSTYSEWFENMRPSEICIFRRPLTY